MGLVDYSIIRYVREAEIKIFEFSRSRDIEK
jgi:hypothetical protein